MQGTFIKPEDILRASNGGLDIILMLYPDALRSVDQPNRKFKIREEKTPSTTIKRIYDTEKSMDVYLVKDWGGDQRDKNAIMCYADENRITWSEALKELAARYNLTGESYKPEVAKATFEERSMDPETEKEGEWYFKLRESFTDLEIETLFSKYTLRSVGWSSNDAAKKKEAYSKIAGICKRYNFYSLESYTIIKNTKALIFSANDTYPMFVIIEKDGDNVFRKIYQPKHEDKSRRFMYHGIKPKEFIHGLSQAKVEYQKREAEAMADDDSDLTDDEGGEGKKKKKKAEKLDEIIIASGGSDALNLALLGYWVCWMNSERAKLQPWDFAAMARISKKVMLLNDIDETGKSAAHDLCMEYLDLYNIELPEELRLKKDSRLNPCKDLRDYLNYFEARKFKELVQDAMPYRFWEQVPQYEGRGSDRMQVGFDYQFDTVLCHNFLNKNGFYRMPVDWTKSEYIFVQVEGNIVRQVSGNKVKNFIHRFLKARRMDRKLRNKLLNITGLNESGLSSMEEISIDFVDFDKHRQFQFFNNCTWEIKADEILEYKPGRVKRFVWEEDVVDQRVKLIDAPFTIKQLPDGDYDIEVHTKDCLFLNYLIQTSRIHWRKELETELSKLPLEEQEAYKTAHKFDIAGPLLTKDEQSEQKQHLVNKIFAIGYLLHRQKDRSRAWAVVAMDNKLNDDGKSHGRSGKSLVFNQAIPKVLKKHFTISGTSPKITDNPHIFHGLTEHHRFTIIDDADKYLNFRFFFEYITSSQTVNPKQTAPYTIPFDKLGKLVWLTNFAMTVDPSTEGRILYTVFSDYYHHKGEDNEYNERRGPKDDFGKQLFDDFTPDEWNLFFNTMARCCQFFIGTMDKIEPPLDNVTKRNLQMEMGENFESWANVYFSSESGNLDIHIVKQEAIDDFLLRNKNLGWTSQRFTRALVAFCRYNHYVLNPVELRNDKDKKRIIHQTMERRLNKDGKWEETGKKTAKEFIYIQTRASAPTPFSTAPSAEPLPF